MCPSIAVLGGGGDGGGGSGGDGSGGDGSGSGSGDGSGEGAGGDGNNAGACGEGGLGSCTNCSAGTSAGDPIDAATGEVFTVPKSDLFLPGFFNLELVRSYSSLMRRHDIGMGWGWSHSLGWSISVRRGSIDVRTAGGQIMPFPKLAPGQSAQVSGWALLRTAEGFVLRPGNEFFHVFVVAEDDPDEFLLREIVYRNRGKILLEYARQRLVRVTDTAGRSVVFGHDGAGHISSISVPNPQGENLVFARYQYDGAGHLVGAVDADGNGFGYEYDDDRRLVRATLPNGLVVHYAYDLRGRCVETWAAQPDGVEPALDPETPKLLADGATVARGILHAKVTYSEEGYSEVADSVRVQRFFSTPGGTVAKGISGRGGVTSRNLDEAGSILAQTDAAGATWRYQYDTLGNVTFEQDPEGRQIKLVRDREGRIAEMVDPSGGVVRHTRDRWGNVTATENAAGAMVSYRLDARGMVVEEILPDGTRRQTEYDAMGNRVMEVLPNGAVCRFQFDYWGRRIAESEPDGRTYRLRFSPSGQVVEIGDDMGRSKSTAYDGLGNVTSVALPDGTATRLERAGLGWVIAEVGPSGAVRATYNREGWLKSLINQAGEKATFEHDANGQIARETTFDGRTRTFKRDARGRVTSIKDALGTTVFERNRVGQIVKMTAANGEERAFEYDARGELVSAMGSGVGMSWQRDAVGKIVGEALEVHGTTYTVDSTRDALGRRTAWRTSVGLHVDARRDALGDVGELWAAGEQVLKFERGPFGSITRRELPLGGAVVDEPDAATRLRRRAVLEAGAPAVRIDGAPERIGGAARPAIEKVYAYSPVDDILSVTTTADGTTEYTYDLARHMTRKRGRRGDEELAFSATGNPFELGPNAPARQYDAGGRLTVKGKVEYVYDARGRLAEKRTRRDDGTPEVTRFRYDGWNMLRAVELPDGLTTELDYDPFARRVEKRVVKKLPTGKTQPVSRTRYVWDLLSVVHEITTRGAAEPEIQTYLFEDNDEPIPLAQRAGTGGSAAGWQHLVGDALDTPEEIVDGAGKPLGRLLRDAYGRTTVAAGSKATTPFRFPGQMEDAESRLHYNRYRYYDPDTGRYLTPDPIGIAGGLSLYEYTRNPIAWIDPMGWQHRLDVTGFRRGSTDLSGHLSRDSYLSGMGREEEDENFCPEEIRNRASCHTERKVLHDIENSGLSADELRGSTLNMRGDYPPCPNCHRAMHDFARRNGMTINYTYPRSGEANTITYGGANPRGSTPAARGLVGAYGMEGRTGGTDPPSSLNPADRYGFTNWSGATSAYRTERERVR